MIYVIVIHVDVYSVKDLPKSDLIAPKCRILYVLIKVYQKYTCLSRI